MHYRYLSALLVGLFFITSASAQSRAANELFPSIVSLKDEPKSYSTDEAIRHISDRYKVPRDYSFQLLQVTKDELGYTHRRFAEYYKNHPVAGGTIIVHERNGRAELINGHAFAVKSVSDVATLSETAAFAAALQAVPATRYIWQGDTARLPAAYNLLKQRPVGDLTWAPAGTQIGAPLRLAYKYDIYAVKPLNRVWVYVDAETGAILRQMDRIIDYNVNGTANTLFSGQRTIKTDSVSSTNYRLWDTTRGGGIHTMDLNTGIDPWTAVEFTDANNIWTSNTNLDKAALDVHWGCEKVYDYYQTVHNRNGYDGADAPLSTYIHYDVNMVNAFWDGTGLYYGDGDAAAGYNPVVSLDVVGHEYTHAVTSYSANLDYWYESGALNESFSDIFGNAIEANVKPASANWACGEDVTTNGSGLRSMSNPNSKSDPDTYMGTYWEFSSVDNGGVHTNSNVQNYWFYLLSAGGSGTNDNGDSYSVTGISIANAAKIAYRTLTMYLTNTSQYADARAYSIQAASDLYGGCSNEVIQTTNAWHAVGVGPVYSPTNGAVSFTASPQNSCTLPVQVQFTNTTPSAQSVLWNFGDGTTSTAQSPAHTYTTNGQFTVKLKVWGCNNAVDSAVYVNFIVVDTTSNFCDTAVMGSGTNPAIVACSGVITDDGGASGYYSNGMFSTQAVSTVPGAYYKIKFSQFATESGYDYLTIYDGPTTSSPVLGSWSGWGLPNSGAWMYTTGNQFLAQFSTDGSVTDAGYVFQYECVTAPPVADFYSSDTLTCDNVATFVNTTLPATGATYTWNFGDGTTSTAANPVHNYTTPGTYTVRLIACNTFGCDTLVRTSYIHYDTSLLICDMVPLPSSGVVSIQNCSGYITDDGGPLGNYSDYSSGAIAISNTSGNAYRFRFTDMDMDWWDNVAIYDGANTSAPLIGNYNGYTLPNNGNWIYTNNSQFYIQFYSDSWVNDSGFVLQYECLTIPPVADFYSADTFSCGPTATFVNTSMPSTGATYTWNFGDGTTSNATAPTHTYAAVGTYTVSLIACNTYGCDTLTRNAYIHYDTTMPACQLTMVPSSGTVSLQDCSGSLTDNGGINGNYSNYLYGGVAVSTTAGSTYRIKFNSFSTESGYDYVTIFDGPNTSSPSLGSWSGWGLPNNGAWIYTTGNQFYLQFYTDGSVTSSGFVADYECLSAAPTINFYSVDTLTCNNTVTFTNTSYPLNGTTWTWNFGDGTTSTAVNPVHVYAAPGLYTVSLAGCNSFGCDTLVRTAYIDYDTTSILCDMTFIPANGGITTIQDCSGFIVDDGGPNGNYSNNVYGGVSVGNTSGVSYRVRFNSFNLDYNDQVAIYDGPNNWSPLIGYYSGTALPLNGGWLYTTGNQFYVEMWSNSYTVDSGFVLEYECLNVPPVADFYSADTLACTGVVNFVNTTSPSTGNTYTWSFGDGTTSTSAAPVKTYSTPGTYTVRLIACNAYGCDTMLRTAYIHYDTSSIYCDMVPLPPFNTNSITSCSGYLTDDGGPLGLYNNNDYSGTTVSNTSGNAYRVKFNNFDMQSGYDFVAIYDGPNNGYPLINYWTGNTLPNNGAWIYTTGSQFYVEEYTDGSIVDTGFILQYECLMVPPVADFYSADSATCSGAVNFTNTTTPAGTGVTYTWSFGDGTTSTQANPFKTYATPGTYTVRLIACNAYGCDTMLRTAYIVYDNTLPACFVTPVPVSGTSYSTNCSGSITDDGGAQGSYSNYVNGGVQVTGQPGSYYGLHFTSFSTESCCDYVYIYDGPTTSSPLLGMYFGSGLPLGGATFYTTGNQFLVAFYTDGSVTYNGFVLEYSCLSATPAAAFYATDSVSCDQNIVFTNTTSPAALTYSWSFGDGATSSLNNPAHTYANPGTYNVSLLACNGSFCNTLTKTVIVDIVDAICVMPDTVNINQPFTLTNASVNATSYNWVVDVANAGTAVNPTFQFSTVGMHEVGLLASNANCNDAINKDIWAKDPTGIDHIPTLSGLSVFPNPARDQITITGMDIPATGLQYALVNTLGQQVVSGSLPALNRTVNSTILLTDVASGVYHLILKTDNGSVTKKIVVDKK